MEKITMILLFLLTIGGSSYGLTIEEENNNTINNKDESKVISLTKNEFIKKVSDFEKNPDTWIYLGDKPCVIDFYATWCGPCKMLSPILKDLSNEYAGKVYFYKIDIDKEPELAKAFGISSIPTLIFSPLKGKPSITQGMTPKAELIKTINSKLLNISSK